MTTPKIFVQLDHNELTRPRAAKVEKAVLEDERFEMRDTADLPLDLQLCLGEKVFHVELKDFSEDENSDYLSSILSGHLYEQILAAREHQEPVAVVILGDDNDVGAAIRKSASRQHGKMDVKGPDVEQAQSIHDKLIEIIMDMPQEETKPKKNLPARQQDVKQGESFDMADWRQKQAKTYNVAGKTAPNAFALSEEANKRGLCTQIMDAGRSKDLVWGHVRVTDPKTGQFREDRVSHGKDTFCLLKAWEDANSQARYQKPGQPALIVGIDEITNMPLLNPDIRIKGMPASLWLTMQVMRSWSMADRDAITKAERRAQLKILNREWRDEGEISLETEEEQAVRESIERQRG